MPGQCKACLQRGYECRAIAAIQKILVNAVLAAPAAVEPGDTVEPLNRLGKSVPNPSGRRCFRPRASRRIRRVTHWNHIVADGGVQCVTTLCAHRFGNWREDIG